MPPTLLSTPARLVLAALATALASAALTWLLIRLSIRLDLVARARSDRWHRRPTPNTGGIAIVLSCTMSFALIVGMGPQQLIIAAAAALAVFGVIDDRVQFRPLTKLAGQAAAAAVVISSGVVLHVTESDAINFAITFLWIIGVTNAFNLIDNMDGLCAGVTIIIAVFRLAVALQTGDTGTVYTLAILAGGYGGFLIFNYNPARIFMGDGGSLFAGFALATLAIASPVPRTRIFLSGLFYPALTFLYPIFDTALVSVMRRLAGRPISVGGRDHSSHRLVSLGLTERHAVWLLWGLAGVGCAAGLLSAWMPIGVIAVAVVLILGVTLFGIFLGTLPAFDPGQAAPVRSARIRRLIPTMRAGITIVVDVLLAGVALLAAFLVRWENDFLGLPQRDFMFSLPIACACHALASIGLRSFHCGWRWFGLRDVVALTKCVAAGSMLFVLVLWVLGQSEYSRGVVLLYAVLTLCLTAGIRAFMRLLSGIPALSLSAQRAAVLGSTAGAELAILICQRQAAPLIPVLVLNSDPAANHTTIHGVPVRSAGRDAASLLVESHANLLLIPWDAGREKADQDIIEACEVAGVQLMKLEVMMTSLAASSMLTPSPAVTGLPTPDTFPA